MKKLCIAVALAGALTATTLHASYDGTISIGSTRQTGYGTGPGGAFTITVKTGLENVVDSTFLSFCIEKNETIRLGGTYYANVNDAAVNGGSGGPSPDPISKATAFLYSQFRAGTLSGYYYYGITGFDVAKGNASANSLQNAIWILEQEMGYYSSNPFVELAKSVLNLNNTTMITTDANGAFGIAVLNLYDKYGHVHQDQLAIVPEPTTIIAGALLLLPFGMSKLRFVRKNRTA